MKLPQEFGHTGSSYERPNDKWICGRAAVGKECIRGPGRRGVCHGSALCFPIYDPRRQAWLCGRQRHHGGKCLQGPGEGGSCSQGLPNDGKCQPVRSLRSQRGLVSFYAGLAALAFVLIASSGREQLHLIDPGSLVAVHGSVSCQECHVAASGTLADWAATTLNGAGWSDSERCLACHDYGENGRAPHALEGDLLALMSRNIRDAFPDVSYPARDDRWH